MRIKYSSTEPEELLKEIGDKCAFAIDDAGIGQYEYWGAAGIDQNLYAEVIPSIETVFFEIGVDVIPANFSGEYKYRREGLKFDEEYLVVIECELVSVDVIKSTTCSKHHTDILRYYQATYSIDNK